MGGILGAVYHGLSQLDNFVQVQIAYRELDGKNEKKIYLGQSHFYFWSSILSKITSEEL